MTNESLIIHLKSCEEQRKQKKISTYAEPLLLPEEVELIIRLLTEGDKR